MKHTLEVFEIQENNKIVFMIEDENGLRYCGELEPCGDCNKEKEV